MRVDLLAGTVYAPGMGSRDEIIRPPTILVFDSGVGGLTVFSELMKARPDARFVYAADDAGFPYGRLTEDEPPRSPCGRCALDHLSDPQRVSQRPRESAGDSQVSSW